jgi:hypothetical protein
MLDLVADSSLSLEALIGANVNPATGLATDYLNHFNEVAMLVDMLPAMPEMADEVMAWRPRPYAEHFFATGYSGAAVAAAAYEAAEPSIKAAFDEACRAVEGAVLGLQERLAGGDIGAVTPDDAGLLYALIAEAGGIVNGETGQSAVDALFD